MYNNSEIQVGTKLKCIKGYACEPWGEMFTEGKIYEVASIHDNANFPYTISGNKNLDVIVDDHHIRIYFNPA